MDLSVAVELLDVRLRSESKTHDVRSDHNEVAGVWTLDDYRADILPAGSTGLELRLSSHGRVIHERTFASSPASMPRIAQSIIEHLTGYRQ
jgi:hypothetical protein